MIHVFKKKKKVLHPRFLLKKMKKEGCGEGVECEGGAGWARVGGEAAREPGKGRKELC